MNASTSQKCYRGYHQECVSTYQVDKPPYNIISLCDCSCHAKELEAAHDAKVRADERERIARAIEGEWHVPAELGRNADRMMGVSWGKREAARIARAGGAS